MPVQCTCIIVLMKELWLPGSWYWCFLSDAWNYNFAWEIAARTLIWCNIAVHGFVQLQRVLLICSLCTHDFSSVINVFCIFCARNSTMLQMTPTIQILLLSVVIWSMAELGACHLLTGHYLTKHISYIAFLWTFPALKKFQLQSLFRVL